MYEPQASKNWLATPPRILIVHSNRDYLGVLARRISRAGYRVATAEGPPAALAELHRAPSRLVLADLGRGGVDLVRIIREDSSLRDLPVVLIAGRSVTSAAVDAFAAGADGVVPKPFHFEILIARIARELERAQALRRLRDDNAVLDARIVARSIELGEMRDRLLTIEAERARH